MGSDQAAPCLLSIPQTVSGRLLQKRNHLQTFRILLLQIMRINKLVVFIIIVHDLDHYQ